MAARKKAFVVLNRKKVTPEVEKVFGTKEKADLYNYDILGNTGEVLEVEYNPEQLEERQTHRWIVWQRNTTMYEPHVNDSDISPYGVNKTTYNDVVDYIVVLDSNDTLENIKKQAAQMITDYEDEHKEAEPED